MLSGATVNQLAGVMTSLKRALSNEINDSALDTQGLYTNVQVPNDTAKSLAREAYNLLVNVEYFFNYINVKENANLLGRAELAKYIQDPGNNLIENIKKALKDINKLSQQEKDQIYVLITACKPLVDFAFDLTQKSVRTENINKLITEIQDSPAIANKGWMERNALSLALKVAKNTTLPAFLIDFGKTLVEFEKATFKAPSAAEPIVPVSQHAVSSNHVVTEDSELDSFSDDSSEEQQAETLTQVSQYLEKIKESQAMFANKLISKPVKTLKEIKIAENENVLILGRIVSLNDALSTIHKKAKDKLEDKKKTEEAHLAQAASKDKELQDQLLAENTAVETSTNALDAVKELLQKFQTKTDAVTSLYYVIRGRNDVWEAVNAKLNAEFRLEDLDNNIKLKLGDKFKDATAWTYQLQVDFKAFLEQEIVNLTKDLTQHQTQLEELSKKVSNNIIAIRKLSEKVKGLGLDIEQLDLDVKKERQKITHLEGLTNDIQGVFLNQKNQIDKDNKVIIEECKKHIKKYQQERHKLYAFNDFFGGLTEKLAKPVNGTFKSVKTQREEYFTRLENALDDIEKNSEDLKAQSELKKVLIDGKTNEKYKSHVAEDQNEKLYVKTFHSCIEKIDQATKALQGGVVPVVIKPDDKSVSSNSLKQ